MQLVVTASEAKCTKENKIDLERLECSIIRKAPRVVDTIDFPQHGRSALHDEVGDSPTA
jgi:hypothetical protein